MRVRLGAKELVELGARKCPSGKTFRKGHARKGYVRKGVRVAAAKVSSSCISKAKR